VPDTAADDKVALPVVDSVLPNVVAPVTLNVPDTSNVVVGFDLPTPTLPLL
jgi:hypothetical protein